MQGIFEGVIKILTTIATLFVTFIGSIVDNFLFNYLPDISLLLGYIGAFFNLILQHINWILDLTGIYYEYWTIIFSLYLLRFALIPVAYLWLIIYGIYTNFLSSK